MQTIKITDVNAAKHLVIDVGTPGVKILRGRNDCGKSLALDSCSRLMGGSGTVTCRDGAAGSGTVEGLGAKVSVRRTPRRTGELEAIGLEGNLSIVDIVDPGIKDPEAADARRIKALVRLSGVKLTPEDFQALVPEWLVLSQETLETKDPVELAARIKREIEAQARLVADAAKKESQSAEVCRKAAEGVDMDGPSAAAILQEMLEDAIGAEADIASKHTSAEKAKGNTEDAKKRIAKAEASYDGMEAKAAEAAVYERSEAVKKSQTDVQAAEETLRQCLKAEEDASASLRAANTAHRTAVGHEATIAGWRETIDRAIPEDPGQAGIDAAIHAVTEARQAVENGAVIRRAQGQLADADVHDVAQKKHAKAAESLRNAARSTDDVLSAAVASDELTVQAGRLVTTVPERGEVFFAERSDGIRWKIAIDEAVRRIKAEGAEETAIIVIPQVAWEGLDPDNQQLVHEYAVLRGVTIITAEAARGELRAEAFVSVVFGDAVVQAVAEVDSELNDDDQAEMTKQTGRKRS